jgi:ABC-type sugar transport system substrate-binding protein
MRRRTLRGVLIGLAVAGALTTAACGDDEDEGTTSSAAPATATEAAPPEPSAASEPATSAGATDVEATTAEPTSEETATEASAPTTEAESTAAQRDLRIGEVFFQTDPFQVALEAWAKRHAEEMGIELLSCNSEAKPELGINCVNDWIAQDLDGIIYAPADPAAAVAPVQDAQKAGVPLIAVVIKPNEPAQMPFVTVNEREQTVEAGKRAATAVQELFPDQKVGVLALDLPNLPICKELRMGGFIEGVKSVAPDAEIHDIGAKGDRLDATNKTTDLIQSGREFNIVTACTGEMVQGAIAALKAAGRGKAQDKTPESEFVFAIDGDKTQMEQLLDPTSPVMLSMGLTPKQQAKTQIDLLLKVVDGTIPPDSTEEAAAEGQLVEPNCDAVNAYLTEQYLEEPLSC